MPDGRLTVPGPMGARDGEGKGLPSEQALAAGMRSGHPRRWNPQGMSNEWIPHDRSISGLQWQLAANRETVGERMGRPRALRARRRKERPVQERMDPNGRSPRKWTGEARGGYSIQPKGRKRIQTREILMHRLLERMFRGNMVLRAMLSLAHQGRQGVRKTSVHRAGKQRPRLERPLEWKMGGGGVLPVCMEVHVQTWKTSVPEARIIRWRRRNQGHSASFARDPSPSGLKGLKEKPQEQNKGRSKGPPQAERKRKEEQETSKRKRKRQPKEQEEQKERKRTEEQSGRGRRARRARVPGRRSTVRRRRKEKKG